jgi:hypothetical protein
VKAQAPIDVQTASSPGEIERQDFPPSDELVIRRLQGSSLEAVLASSAAVRREMRANGRQLVASSWRPTRRGVTMELAFSEDPSRR